MRARSRRSLPLAVCLAATVSLGLGGAAAAQSAAAPTVWHVAIDGAALGAPAPLVDGQILLPLASLVPALGDVVVAVSASDGIALDARAGPPEAYLAAPASVLLTASSIGPGYTRATPAPAKTPAPVPGDAAARLADASAVFTSLPAKALTHLPVSVAYGPAELALTAAEYASAAAAAQALADTTAALTAKGGTWPGVAGPYTPVSSLPGPLGDAASVFTAARGRIDLVAMRVNNWVVTSAVGGTSLDAAWTLWLEQVHRIQAVPQPTVVRGAAGMPTTQPVPGTDEGPLVVRLDGVPLGTAVWTAEGYALPAVGVEQALELLPERTGATSLNLQDASLVDGGAAPPVIAPPQGVLLSPTAVFGVPFAPVSGASASNSSLEQATPGIVYQLTDWGRMASYAVEFETKPKSAARSGAPEAIYVGLVEFSTSAGALDAVETEAGSLTHVQTGARPLALGDLNGAGGIDDASAVVAHVFAKKATTQDDWFLYQVDNWEVLVGASDPAGYFTPRTLWPYLTALGANIALDGRAAP